MKMVKLSFEIIFSDERRKYYFPEINLLYNIFDFCATMTILTNV